ncbi:hypothetical protein KTD31_00190 [Burkholderia multivorans]|jgi:hypothetical protein|uniref:hypothetical protein n=1 Tax=Burkholderia multivorans TaxID=87883 RepID=UPI001C213300|nr:hypothetical protein [Burkholderia multivorans]MBU9199817.1 hypothetical protein [Burkholderia multivorans]MDN8079064.1 hypothetical protein [Burkholderia multivorans]
MNEYLAYIAIGFGLLLVSLVVPGLKVIAEAIFKALFELITELFKHKATFIVWIIKTLSSDHVRVIQHATQARDVIDPTQKIRRKAEGYED